MQQARKPKKVREDARIQTQIDVTIKKEAAVVLSAIGLTVSDAVRLMLTRVAREKTLPFDPLIPNETTIAAMKDVRAGKVESVTLDDLQAVLDAENQANLLSSKKT